MLSQVSLIARSQHKIKVSHLVVLELEDGKGDENIPTPADEKDAKPFWGYVRFYEHRVYLPRIPQISQPTLVWRRRLGKK